MSNITRRALVGAIPAVAASAAIPAAANAIGSDAELRRLWAEYLDCVRAHELATAAYKPARETFDAEHGFGPAPAFDPDGYKRWKAAWREAGLEPLCDAWNDTGKAVTTTADAIRKTEATTLSGIGIKLAALPNSVEVGDLDHIIAYVLADIDRLTGETFLMSPGGILVKDEADRLDAFDAEDHEEEDENEGRVS